MPPIHAADLPAGVRIIDVLVDVPRATADKLAEDLNVTPVTVRRYLVGLVEARLVEPAGLVPSIYSRRGRPAQTYRLHPRLRGHAP